MEFKNVLNTLILPVILYYIISVILTFFGVEKSTYLPYVYFYIILFVFVLVLPNNIPKL